MDRRADVSSLFTVAKIVFDMFSLDIQEIYGSQYELPELGPLGASGLAQPREFEYPVSSFDIDQSPWEIIYK